MDHLSQNDFYRWQYGINIFDLFRRISFISKLQEIYITFYYRPVLSLLFSSPLLTFVLMLPTFFRLNSSCILFSRPTSSKSSSLLSFLLGSFKLEDFLSTFWLSGESGRSERTLLLSLLMIYLGGTLTEVVLVRALVRTAMCS